MNDEESFSIQALRSLGIIILFVILFLAAVGFAYLVEIIFFL